MKEFPCLKILSVILFVILIFVGLFLAKHKGIWNDEKYSQVAGIESFSYSEILLGKVDEGNNNPLFYVIQKAITNAFGWHSNAEFRMGINTVGDRIILRISPVCSIALTVVAIFYFFSKFYSIWAGLFSLFISLSTHMLWGYWAEARPYALWILLTTIQLLLFLYIIHTSKAERLSWRWLAFTHVLLSLTFIFSLAQIMIVSVVLCFTIQKKWISFIWLTLLPCILIFYYYGLTPNYNFWVMFEYEQYIREGITRDRLYIILLFLIFLTLSVIQLKWKSPKLANTQIILEGFPYFCVTILMIAATCVFIAVFHFKSTGHDEGFPVTTRYFINLVPVGIISTTYFTVKLLNAFKGKIWMQSFIFSLIGYLVIYRFLRVIKHIKGFYPDIFL